MTEYHRYLATFPPTLRGLGESTSPLSQADPAARNFLFSNGTLETTVLHSFLTLHQAKASREALLGLPSQSPRGEELPQPQTPVQMSHTPLFPSEL